MNNHEELMRKALCYCICVDIARAAICSLGSANTVEKNTSTLICYENMIKESKSAAQGGNK